MKQIIALLQLASTLCLDEHNMAFREINDKLYEQHNGNLLGLIKLLTKFVKMGIFIQSQKGLKKHTYLSHSTQNELIENMGEKVRIAIIKQI